MDKHLYDILLAMSEKRTIILEGATKEGQVGQPAGVPMHIVRHDQGGFVVYLHNGESAYYHPRTPR